MQLSSRSPLAHARITGERWTDGPAQEEGGDEQRTGAIATVAAVLAPGGWFSFSVFHPC
jgi:hypothetical protein